MTPKIDDEITEAVRRTLTDTEGRIARRFRPAVRYLAAVAPFSAKSQLMRIHFKGWREDREERRIVDVHPGMEELFQRLDIGYGIGNDGGLDGDYYVIAGVEYGKLLRAARIAEVMI